MYRTIRTRMHLHQTVLEKNTSSFHKNIGKQQRLKTKQETTHTNTHQPKTSTSKPNLRKKTPKQSKTATPTNQPPKKPTNPPKKPTNPTQKKIRWSEIKLPRSCKIQNQLHCWHTRPRCRCLLPGLVLLCTMVLNNSGPGSRRGEAQRPLRYGRGGRIRPG